ncbi:hypothetical protein [Desulfurobacterium indicum]|uniref:Uncharacterized protein n=1 Tax=Desulfurobacterium indicum TaxID=1914305 RepID=A0A1R1MKR2_9BACT|nr:hypothetical protein [Desulfurobacterium indicum]OMH40395.1 hypothetical protein BLW93_05570 [Desulfurobacterium indicum]
MGFWDLFKNITEEEKLNDLIGLSKHLIEREEEAFIKRKLQQNEDNSSKKKVNNRKNKTTISYKCGFPYGINNGETPIRINFNSFEWNFGDSSTDIFLTEDDDFIDALMGILNYYYFLLFDYNCFSSHSFDNTFNNFEDDF